MRRQIQHNNQFNAIAISKRERLQDLKVAKKRKLKKEDYEPVISEKCGKDMKRKV